VPRDQRKDGDSMRFIPQKTGKGREQGKEVIHNHPERKEGIGSSRDYVGRKRKSPDCPTPKKKGENQMSRGLLYGRSHLKKGGT